MRVRAVALLASSLFVAACTGRGEPSEDDIRAALTLAGNLGGAKAVKLACKRPTDKPGFVCDYRAPVCNRFTGKCTSPRPGSGRFLRANTRWQLVEDLSPRSGANPAAQPSPSPSITFAPTPGATPTPTTFTPTPTPTPTLTTQPSGQPTVRPLPDTQPDWVQEEQRRRTLSPRDVRIITRWLGLNDRCRIGDDADDASRAACEERDKVAQRMRRRGLCYGGGEGEAMARWQRCE